MTTRIKVPLRPIPKIIIPHASILRRAFGGGIGAGAFRQNDRASLAGPTGEKLGVALVGLGGYPQREIEL